MQKTRFEGQAGPASAAARPSRLLSGLVFCAVIATAGCVDTSKATGGREVNGAISFIQSPEGTVPPNGLELVKLGMTVSEVESLLSNLYEVNRYVSEVERNVIVDYFFYHDGDEEKIAEIYYRLGKVYLVSFGYSSYRE